MNKKELIKQIKKEVNAGYILQVSTPDNKKINLWLSDGGKHILFRNFGQSAIKNNLQALTWLINTFLGARYKTIEYKHIKSTID